MAGWPTAWHPVLMDATELAALTRRFRKAEAAVDAARAELQAAALQAIAEGMSQADVARVTGWTRETLRKAAKAAAPTGE